MGSASGKYDIKDDSPISNKSTTLPLTISSSNRSKKEKASLPQFLHKNSSLSIKDDLTLIWLDTEIHNQSSNIDIQIKLKNLFNYFRIFDELNKFEEYIKKMTQMNEEKIFIIISTTLSLTMLPYLHKHSQIKCIYIFGKDKVATEIIDELSKKYPKV